MPATGYRDAVTASQPDPPRPPGTIVRSRQHIENVRRDAAQAAKEIAAEYNEEPDRLILDAIAWALGDGEHAPFTTATTPGMAAPADIAAEIAACREFLHRTPWSDEAADSITRAQDVSKLLEWLTGADDRPPTYGRDTEPGDLVGGRGRIIRPGTDIRRVLALARDNLTAGRTSYALGADWHRGVIATLAWVLGDQAESPVHGSARPGLPDGARIAIEGDEAAELTTPPLRDTAIPLHYADAVAVTCRWLLGDTTQPPATGPHPAPGR